jgi:branched-subunit amino acid aminotransferase/4-amino-4-deoxychorismate lyase
VIEKDITPDELLKADEIFLTGTTNFVTIIEKLEDRVFETSSYATKVFERLQTLIS